MMSFNEKFEAIIEGEGTMIWFKHKI